MQAEVNNKRVLVGHHRRLAPTKHRLRWHIWQRWEPWRLRAGWTRQWMLLRSSHSRECMVLWRRHPR
jgi:hypothetical protein